jgi:hypothetical protein
MVRYSGKILFFQIQYTRGKFREFLSLAWYFGCYFVSDIIYRQTYKHTFFQGWRRRWTLNEWISYGFIIWQFNNNRKHDDRDMQITLENYNASTSCWWWEILYFFVCFLRAVSWVFGTWYCCVLGFVEQIFKHLFQVCSLSQLGLITEHNFEVLI